MSYIEATDVSLRKTGQIKLHGASGFAGMRKAGALVAKCLDELEDTATSKCTLPFVDEQLRAAREMMGHDFWSYGLPKNRKVLETFLRHHHAEGLSPRLVTPEEMFHPSTHETFTI